MEWAGWKAVYFRVAATLMAWGASISVDDAM